MIRNDEPVHQMIEVVDFFWGDLEISSDCLSVKFLHLLKRLLNDFCDVVVEVDKCKSTHWIHAIRLKVHIIVHDVDAWGSFSNHFTRWLNKEISVSRIFLKLSLFLR